MIAFTDIVEAESWLVQHMRGDTSILRPASPWPVTRWTYNYSEYHRTWMMGFRHTIVPGFGDQPARNQVHDANGSMTQTGE